VLPLLLVVVNRQPAETAEDSLVSGGSAAKVLFRNEGCRSLRRGTARVAGGARRGVDERHRASGKHRKRALLTFDGRRLQ
jgi:hypothetical protein